MNAFELLMISSIMMVVFATKMKMWQTSLNSYVVIFMAAVVSASYQTPQMYLVFEHRVWIFNAVLLFIFGRVSYQSITHKYQEMTAMQKEVEDTHKMLETIGDTIPDMLWAKDINGKYIYANKAIRDKLLFQEDPIGKTDSYCADKAKEKYGDENHTFGEVCGNSDKVVLAKEEPQRFLESGNVLGEMSYLEVNKAPLYDSSGMLVGVCGTGRDMTEYVTAYRTHECGKCPLMRDIFARYEFKE
jgi:PAS domain-containing protein